MMTRLTKIGKRGKGAGWAEVNEFLLKEKVSPAGVKIIGLKKEMRVTLREKEIISLLNN